MITYYQRMANDQILKHYSALDSGDHEAAALHMEEFHTYMSIHNRMVREDEHGTQIKH